MNYMAEAVSDIAKRMKELAEEREQAKRNQDPQVATGDYLDRIGENYSVKRNECESDYTFRQRILTKQREESGVVSYGFFEAYVSVDLS